MISGLQELEVKYSRPEHQALRIDIRKAIQSLERVWKSIVPY